MVRGENMSMEWFRWYHNTTSDPKLSLIAKKSKRPKPEVIAVWISLLEHASEADKRGSIESIDVEIMGVNLDMDEESITSIIDAMNAKGMIQGGSIEAWNRRQTKREDDSKERVRAFREREKPNKKQYVTQGNASVTQGNASVTPQSRVDKTRSDTDTQPVVCVESLPRASARTRDATEGGNMDSEIQKPEPTAQAVPITIPKATPPTVSKSGHPIPDDWEPRADTVAALESMGIPLEFTADCVLHFRIHHTEAGTLKPNGFESLFVGWCRSDWAKRQGQARAGQQLAPRTPDGKPIYASRQEARMTVREWDDYLADRFCQQDDGIKTGEVIRAH